MISSSTSLAEAPLPPQISIDATPLREIPQRGLVARIRSLLDGRWIWAIVLGLVIGGAAGAAGWRFGSRAYVSRGHVHVAAYIDDYGFNYGVDRSLRSQNYDSLIETQMQFMKTMRVIDKAMDSEAWRALGRPYSPQKVQEFVGSLQVSRKGEIIFVEMRDTDPNAAMIGVRAVVDAYKQLNDEEDSQRDKNKLDFLRAEQARSINRISQLDVSIRNRFHDLGGGHQNFGPEDLEPLFVAKLTESEAYENRLQEVRRELVIRKSGGASAGATSGPADAAAPHIASASAAQQPPDLEQIAMESTQMAGYLSQRRALQDNYTSARIKYGDSHPFVKSLERDIDSLDQAIDEFAKRYVSWQSDRKNGVSDLAEIARLEKLEASLVKSVQEANQNLESISKLRHDIHELKEQTEHEQQNRDDLRKRIETEEGLARVPGHIRVLDPGDKPALPTWDSRPVLASVGGLGGCALGFGFIAFLGYLDRGVRGPADTNLLGLGRRPILGLLPQLPQDLTDPAEALQAAHCVHQVRTMLQLWYGGIKRPVLAITGAEAGAGKTTLTLALGVSFATAHSKTLLIDFDWVGGGLTSRANLIKRRRIGQILLSGGAIEPHELEEGLHAAKSDGSSLGQALVRLGHVGESDLQAALERQEQSSLGVLDALRNEPLAECIAHSTIPNLSILSLGSAGANEVGSVSPLAIQRLIETARSQFDVVLIDTGPVPGSLEGGAAVAVADGTILTISRGNSRSRVRQCTDYLNSVNARLAGVVFNRATTKELAGIGSDSSGSLGRSRAASAKTQARESFGPFGTAVAQASRGPRGDGQ